MKTRRFSIVAAALALCRRRHHPVRAGTVGTQRPLVKSTPQQLTLKPKARTCPISRQGGARLHEVAPERCYLGEGIGVSRNSKGHIFVNTCSQQTRVLEFDQNGNYVREIGKELFGLICCHGVRVDAQDNIWAIDEGSN